ncbi:MAG TPA: AMP-binding protein, partial [Bacteroidales bacterium]|nr:AMP-binding protein [Bacteroidales bacterium]
SRTIQRFPHHGIGFIRLHHPETFLTFPELEQKALSYLTGLQDMGITAGDRVILSLGKNEEIIPVLWACFIGGIIPALLQPPVTFTETNPAAEKAEKVFSILGNPWVILSHDHAGKWNTGRIPARYQVDVTRLAGDPDRALRCLPDTDSLALIQFSSGSTGDPKGVLLSHRNILVNTADIIHGIALEPADIAVNWMPLYHDMGLIGFHITPVRVGVNQYFIDPIDFIKQPALWPDTMTGKRCTITACPNFGQMLMNRHLSRRSGQAWDLSAVRILFNGAEPISVSTMHIFLSGMARFGLNPKAMFPAYGLAEASLAVTFPERGKGAVIRRFKREELLRGQAIETPENGSDVNSVELVDLGHSLPNTSLMVADSRNHPVHEGRVGNILVKGENCSRGYYGQPVSGPGSQTGGWLITGDLGFIHRGSLFITGRKKDIIFINGANFYAHDLEGVVFKSDPSLEGKLVMAGFFDEQEGRDRLLIFVSGLSSKNAALTCKAIRAGLSASVGLSPDTFILIRSADIPRTSSGKIQRYKMTERYARGGFETVLRI